MFSDARFCLSQWCEQKEQCTQLYLPELLAAPLRRLTWHPLLVSNVCEKGVWIH